MRESRAQLIYDCRLMNTAIANGNNSLGIRLRASPLNDRGAWTFDTFRLTTDNQGTINNVPEPQALALLLAGLGVLGVLRARQSRQG